MIVLDTNVVSEMMRSAPNPAVTRWLNAHDSDELYVTVITIAEITYGIRILPEGRRRQDLSDRFERLVERGFKHRVLDFNAGAGHVYGAIMSHRRRLGRPMSTLDGQITAIAKTHGMAIATRNATDFEATGIDLVNPWDAS